MALDLQTEGWFAYVVLDGLQAYTPKVGETNIPSARQASDSKTSIPIVGQALRGLGFLIDCRPAIQASRRLDKHPAG